MNWFSDIVNRLTGGSPSREERGVSITDDGISINGTALDLKIGETLLVSYRCSSNLDQWKHIEVEFRPESLNTLFVYTDERPVDVTVLKKSDLQKHASLRRIPVCCAHDDEQETLLDCDLYDLLDPMYSYSPLSPYSAWNVDSPTNFMQLFYNASRDEEVIEAQLADPFQGVDALEIPSVEASSNDYESGFQSSEYSDSSINSPFSSSEVTIEDLSDSGAVVQAEVESEDAFGDDVNEDSDTSEETSDVSESDYDSSGSSTDADTHSEDPAAY